VEVKMPATLTAVKNTAARAQPNDERLEVIESRMKALEVRQDRDREQLAYLLDRLDHADLERNDISAGVAELAAEVNEIKTSPSSTLSVERRPLGK
jgi:septal ring factor EnvC (AmiA/AmiB activator)